VLGELLAGGEQNPIPGILRSLQDRLMLGVGSNRGHRRSQPGSSLFQTGVSINCIPEKPQGKERINSREERLSPVEAVTG
jgi:hypothetical protein